MTKEEREALEKRAHEMSIIGFAETLDNAIMERRALDATHVPHERDPFAPVMAKYEALLVVTGKLTDRLDEAVRLLERWEQRWQPMARIYTNTPLDGETAAFLVRVRP